MANFSNEKIKCPKCNKEVEVKIWNNVNTDINKELKEKILDKSLYKCNCPECDELIKLNYDILYHDMNNKQMIYYVTTQNSYNKAINMFNYEERNEYTKRMLDKYQRRIVLTQNQLAEKILIKDRDLDDRIVEIIKLLIYEKVEKDFDELVYSYDKEKNTNVILGIKENTMEVIATFDENMYNSVYQQYKAQLDMFGEDNIVDLGWVCYRFGIGNVL